MTLFDDNDARAFDDTSRIPRAAHDDADQIAAAKGDAYIYGVGYVIDGRAVSPLRVRHYVYDGDELALWTYGTDPLRLAARRADAMPGGEAAANRLRKAALLIDEARGWFGNQEVPEPPIIPQARTTDPTTSHRAARDVAPRAGSQRWKILAAYREAHPAALTAEQACRYAGIPTGWRRISELEAFGYLEPTGGEHANMSGSEARLLRITSKGFDALR